MSKEDLELNSKIRRVLVQHRVDTSRISMACTNGSVRLHGVVARDDGSDVQPAVMSVIDQKLNALHGLRRVTYEFDNLINNGESWVQIGSSRAAKESSRQEDMLAALRIRQILVGFRLDASQVNITVANGVGRLFGRIAMENGEDVVPTVLSAVDDRVGMTKGITRCIYEFENMFHTGEAWIPINRRRRRDRREAGGKIES